jgi:hypothetical protein
MKMKNNLPGHSKGCTKRKVYSMSAYIKRSERSQINDVILQLKLLEEQEKSNPKTRRRREIIFKRAEINKIKTKKTQRIKETKSWFFEKINKIHRPLANLTKMRKEKNSNQ